MNSHKRIFTFLFTVTCLAITSYSTETCFGEGGNSMPQIHPAQTIRLYEQMNEPDKIPVITCIDLERSGRMLAVGGDDSVVRLWDVQSKRFTLGLREHIDLVRSLTFSPDQTRLITIGHDGQAELWNVQTGENIKTISVSLRGTQKTVFHPDGTQFAVCGFENKVQIYDAQTGKLLHSLTAHGTSNGALAFSADGSLLAVGGRTGVVRVWQTSDYRLLKDLKGDGRRVNALVFATQNSAQNTIAVAGDGPFIMLWDARQGTLIRHFDERPGKTYSMAFCGKNGLVSGESDNVIRYWDTTTGKNTAELIGHTGTVSTMTFEPATNRLVTGSFDTLLCFWDLPTEGPVTKLPISEAVVQPAPVTVPAVSTVPEVPAAPKTAFDPFAQPVQTATPANPATPAVPISF